MIIANMHSFIMSGAENYMPNAVSKTFDLQCKI